MNPRPPNFIIEEGPERGREITIPPDGARMGRATENDVVISDASMSRFQCRLYFRDGFLHVMDLGSTNETLVNDIPVSDQVLRHGDHLLIGESMLRVVNDGLGDVQPAILEEAPAPIVPMVRFNPDPEPEEEAPAPIILPDATRSSKPVTLDEAAPVDLGLGKRDVQPDAGEKGERSFSVVRLLVTAGTTLLVIFVGFILLLQQNPPPPAAPPVDNSLRFDYEKVQAGNGNIFRYFLSLKPDGTLVANIHDLTQQRNINREEKLDAKSLQQLRDQLLDQRDVFFGLRDDYSGVAGASHESYSLTVIFGKDAKQVRVQDQLEPDAFRDVREKIEGFASNFLGLSTLYMAPEVLRERADDAWEVAQKLYAERDVKNGNLWEATQRLKEAAWMLETIEPKPDYYRQALQLREAWMEELLTRVRNLDFEAVREYQVGNREKAAELYRRIMATLPDRSHTYYTQAYNNLVRLEQELSR